MISGTPIDPSQATASAAIPVSTSSRKRCSACSNFFHYIFNLLNPVSQAALTTAVTRLAERTATHIIQETKALIAPATSTGSASTSAGAAAPSAAATTASTVVTATAALTQAQTPKESASTFSEDLAEIGQDVIEQASGLALTAAQKTGEAAVRASARSVRDSKGSATSFLPGYATSIVDPLLDAGITAAENGSVRALSKYVEGKKTKSEGKTLKSDESKND
ncbi:MAG: hypothetical protein H0W88_03085 [Parachlamydiaceae bacterium]|nr:hypothetical protein [Parachlamydiaceae bacterium]